MNYTFLDMREYCKDHIENGVSASSTKAKDAINEAVEIIMNEGDFKYTRRLMKLGLCNRTVGCPEFVEAILAHTVDGNPAFSWSMGYEFMHSGPGLLTPGNDIPGHDLVDKGNGWATFFPIGETKRVLLAFSNEEADKSLTIRIRGKGDLHNDISPSTPGELIPINYWDGGVEGQSTAGRFIPSQNEFLEISSIIKPVTAGYVTLYAYDPDTHAMWFLSKYAPHETQPGYRRYRIGDTNYSTNECITALVKLRFSPMDHDTDVSPIQNRFALRMMCKSIHEFSYGEYKKASVYYAQALRSLDRELSNSEPNRNEYDFDLEGSFGNIPGVL